MSKLEEREARRKQSVISSLIGQESDQEPKPEQKPERTNHTATGGRPKTNRETKKRVSLAVYPSKYSDFQKIAYVERRSASDIIDDLIDDFINQNMDKIAEYERIKSE